MLRFRKVDFYFTKCDPVLIMHPFELDIIRSIQTALRSQWLDSFFLMLDECDRLPLSIFFVAWFVAFLSSKSSSRVVVVFLMSNFINYLLKELWAVPRPCHVDAGLGVICHSSFACPSRAAQTAVLALGIIWGLTSSRWIRAITVLFSLSLCFSRIYLGVHFPTDVVVGGVISLGLLYVYYKVLPLYDQYFDKIFLVVALLLFLVYEFDDAAVAIGFAWGFWMQKKYEIKSGFVLKTLSWGLSFFGSFLLFVLSIFEPDWAPAFLILSSFWFSFLGVALLPFLWNIATRRLFLRKRASNA